MGKPAYRTTAPLWFRRWSRSQAAVFHSLHSVVLIGCLRANVLVSLSRKTASLVVPAAPMLALQEDEGRAIAARAGGGTASDAYLGTSIALSRPARAEGRCGVGGLLPTMT